MGRLSGLLRATVVGCLISSVPALAAAPVEEQSSTLGEGRAAGLSAQQFFELQQLRLQVERLQGVAEEQANELDKLRRTQRELYEDLDRRLKQAGAPASSRSAELSSSATSSNVTTAPENSVTRTPPRTGDQPVCPL